MMKKHNSGENKKPCKVNDVSKSFGVKDVGQTIKVKPVERK